MDHPPSPSLLDGVPAGYGDIAEQATQMFLDSTQQLRERAVAASEQAAAYARQEPVKALLIAAAAGALLMGLLSLMAGSSD